MPADIVDGKSVNAPQVTGSAVLGAGTDGLYHVLKVGADGSISGGPVGGTLTDRSGTITTGGTAQQLAPANASRHYLLVVNDSATETMWINFTTTAVTSEPSIPILANGSFVMESSFVSTEAVSIIAATTGHPWTAKEG